MDGLQEAIMRVLMGQQGAGFVQQQPPTGQLPPGVMDEIPRGPDGQPIGGTQPIMPGAQDVSGGTYAGDAAKIARQSALAKALMEQSQQPQETQKAGRFLVPNSKLSGVTKVLQGVTGQYQQKKADEKQAALENKSSEALAKALRGEELDLNDSYLPPELKQQLTLEQFKRRQSKADAAETRALTEQDDRRQVASWQDTGGKKVGMNKFGEPIGELEVTMKPGEKANLEFKYYSHATPSGGAQLSAQTARRGQDITLRGQDISAATAMRGQDLRAAGTVTNPGGGALTQGQKTADREFAKEYVKFKAGGGVSDVQKNLDQLKDARTILSKENVSGPGIGLMPDAVRGFTNPQSIAVREQVQEIAQRNLRLILGGQFAQKEGEQLINRVYNERLPESENIKRLDRLVTQIEAASKAKEDAANYFEQHGTLAGWDGKLYTINDFDPDSGSSDDTAGVTFDADKERRYQEWKRSHAND